MGFRLLKNIRNDLFSPEILESSTDILLMHKNIDIFNKTLRGHDTDFCCEYKEIKKKRPSAAMSLSIYIY